MLTENEIKEWKQLPPDLSGMRASIIGMARSGVAAAKLLKSRGCHVLVSDSKSDGELKRQASALQNLDIDIELGKHSDRLLECDFIVRSPGVPADIAILRKAQEDGILIVSEIEVASWFCRAPIIAVTGSNGKTTTVEWIGDLFGRSERKVAVCGNVGTPFSAIVDDLDEESVAVLEISSFQLENIVRFRPRVAAVTNFSPDHLDRYASYEAYIRTKCRIFENQNSDDALIFNRGDARLSSMVTGAKGKKLSFGCDESFEPGVGLWDNTLVVSNPVGCLSLMKRTELSLRGQHNLENGMVVVCVALEMKVPFKALQQSLCEFKGVPHRLEVVTESHGILWINDSKATNIASAMVALDSFERPLILLAGGRDKGSDFAGIAPQLNAKVKSVILFGEAGSAMENAWKKKVKLKRAETLEKAVKLAAKSANEGDVILLSPMCASFDEFDNYMHRGDTFKELVKEYGS